jgi:type IV secretion system protein TrbI
MTGDRSEDRNEAPGEEPRRTDLPEPPRDTAAAFRLRPERPKVMRLSRRALGALAGVSALALGGALVFALQSSHPKAQSEELYNTDHRTTADGLARLPGDYAGVGSSVPQLGPPLPGDLGRPMLKASAPPPAMAPGAGSAPDPAQQRAEQERQRRAQELEAARTSRLFASEGRTTAQGTGQSTLRLDLTGLAGQQPAVAALPSGSPNEGDRKLAFLNGAADRKTISAERIAAPPSPYVVQAGAVIAAAMVTGLRSDLPGQIVAQVTENVYDGPTGRTLLIPQGARLVGQYDAQVVFGQSRALLVWTRLIFPNGRSLVLERQPGADSEGYAGLKDRVDNHWGQLFKAAILSTLLSAGSEAGTSSDENDLVQALRRGASDSISQTGRQVVGRSLNVQPTITVRPGFPVRVVVTRDLILEPYRG